MSDVDIRLLSRTGTPITALPDANLTAASWVLSESGTASFDIHPLARGADKIEVWKTEVQIWWDGVLRWVGPVTGCTGGPHLLTFNCEEVLSWLKKRIIDRTSLFYGTPADAGSPGNPDANPPIPATPPTAEVLVEQFTIAWNLIAYAQGETVQANRNFRMLAGAYGPSGKGRTAQYRLADHRVIYDLLQDFRNMHQGFEFDVTYAGDGGRFWTPYYPTKGSVKPQFTMMFDQNGDRNIATFDYTEDGLGMSTETYSTGGTVLGQKIEDNYEDEAASAERGVLQTVISDGSSVDHAFLQDKARKNVDSKKAPIKKFTINSARTLNLDLFGKITTGDSIPLRINHGRIQANETRRIAEIAWNPDDTLSLTFVEEDAA